MTEHAVGVLEGTTVALLDRDLAENYVANHDAAIFGKHFGVPVRRFSTIIARQPIAGSNRAVPERLGLALRQIERLVIRASGI